jgi:hypothetical protein
VSPVPFFLLLWLFVYFWRLRLLYSLSNDDGRDVVQALWALGLSLFLIFMWVLLWVISIISVDMICKMVAFLIEEHDGRMLFRVAADVERT